MVVGTLKKSSGGAAPAVLSPFKGGLNNVGEGATIDDAQLAVLQNFDIDTDGTLVNRPPIENTGVLPPIGVVRQINYNQNPKAANGTTGYSAFGSSGATGVALSTMTTAATVPGFTGTVTLPRVSASAALSYFDIRYNSGGGLNLGTISQGVTYSANAYVRTNASTGLVSVIYLQFLASDNSIIQSFASDALTLTGSLQRIAVTGVAPPGTTNISVVVRASGTVQSGHVFDAGLQMITNTTAAVPYYDGDNLTTATDRYEWGGTPNASFSNHWDIVATPAPMIPLGYYVRADGQTSMVATGGGRTWLYELVSKTWTQIWQFAAADFAQYDNKVVLIAEDRAGGYWEGGVFTATSTMPMGSGIVVYGERFWAFGPKGTASSTTIYFSNVTAVNPATTIYTWTTATDFFVVNKGDGQYITAIVADPNALLIFRSASTYQFTYPNAPANGTLSLLNSSVGADHRFAVVKYENFYWVLNQGYLYQFISYQFYPRNTQIVRFTPNPNAQRYVDTSVSVLGERIIVYYYGNLYVYSVRQQTWAEWVPTTAVPGRVMQMPADASGTGPRQALAWLGMNTGNSARRVLLLTDSPTGSGLYAGEPMTCTMRTKTFDFNLAGTFKRLLYWAIRFRSARGASGQVVPVGVNGGSITFDDMEGSSFDDFDLATWDAPIFKIPVFVDNIDFPMPSAIQALAKARAPIRFLSAYFEVTLSTDGTPASAPARVFSVTAYLKQHADTGEKVS